MADETKRVAATINTLLDSDFDKTYAQARDLAVREQRTKLNDVLYLDPAEIEKLVGSEPLFLTKRLEEVLRTVQLGHPLVEMYVTRVVSGRALFDETKVEIGERIAAATNEGLAQLWRQLQRVRQHEGSGAIELSMLKATILRDVEQIAKQASVKSYGVFPSVYSAIDKRAETWEDKLFTGMSASS
jgi:hypothetical protein